LIEDPPRLGRAFDALRAHESNQRTPRCVIHGDAHLGNTYVSADGRRLWLDWQMVRRGRPWRDIAWFLIGALEIEDRRSAEGDLLRGYLEQLRALGVCDVTFDAAWSEYRLWPVWGLVAWQGNLDAWGQPSLAPLARFAAAAEDLQTLKLLNA
jgi:aminoglycoside phosphotransferase (APT) family kinase protein